MIMKLKCWKKYLISVQFLNSCTSLWCRAEAGDCCAPGRFPFSLTERKWNAFRESYSCIITMQSRKEKKDLLLSLLVNFAKILVPVCKGEIVSDCYASGPFPDGADRKEERNAFNESHQLSLCNYAEIKVLKYLYSGWQKESPEGLSETYAD